MNDSNELESGGCSPRCKYAASSAVPDRNVNEQPGGCSRGCQLVKSTLQIGSCTKDTATSLQVYIVEKPNDIVTALKSHCVCHNFGVARCTVDYQTRSFFSRRLCHEMHARYHGLELRSTLLAAEAFDASRTGRPCSLPSVRRIRACDLMDWRNGSDIGKKMEQDALWNFVQTEAVEAFGGAGPRLGWLARQLVPGARVLNIGVGDGAFEAIRNATRSCRSQFGPELDAPSHV